jgi:REP element-mobilizing transposase RayT
MAERDEFAGTPSRIFPSPERAMGQHVWARGYLAVSSGTITDKMVEEDIVE